MLVKKMITHVSEYKEGDAIVGGNIYMSLDDARGILNITDLSSKEDNDVNGTEFKDRLRSVGMDSRDILRKMAKTILFSGKNMTTAEELRKKLDM